MSAVGRLDDGCNCFLERARCMQTFAQEDSIKPHPIVRANNASFDISFQGGRASTKYYLSLRNDCQSDFPLSPKVDIHVHDRHSPPMLIADNHRLCRDRQPTGQKQKARRTGLGDGLFVVQSITDPHAPPHAMAVTVPEPATPDGAATAIIGATTIGSVRRAISVSVSVGSVSVIAAVVGSRGCSKQYAGS